MPEYRRSLIPGGTFFFTVNLADRRSALLVREVEALRTAIRGVRIKSPFHIDAWVILPEHMHCIWTLPENDSNYSARWQAIKISFSKTVAHTRPHDKRSIWQHRFWEHTIRDERDYHTHMDYVHFNPVKHRLVNHPADWPFSTFTTNVKRGFYDAAWASPEADIIGMTVGERS